MPNAFVLKKHAPRLNNIVWDKYYIERTLKDKVKKTGDGDEDFVIVKEVVESKTLIQDVIESQADDVGLENILKKFAKTGDESILPERVNTGDAVFDMTQLPVDLIEADNFYKQQKALFDSLPSELTKGRSFNEFMTHFNQAEFNAYIAALADANLSKDDVKKGDDK